MLVGKMLGVLIESYLLYRIGGGFSAGLIVGILVRLFLKFLICIGLLYSASLAYLEYKGIISINWDRLYELFFSLKGLVPKAYDLIASFGVVAPSFLLGFYIGVREK